MTQEDKTADLERGKKIIKKNLYSNTNMNQEFITTYKNNVSMLKMYLKPMW